MRMVAAAEEAAEDVLAEEVDVLARVALSHLEVQVLVQWHHALAGIVPLHDKSTATQRVYSRAILALSEAVATTIRATPVEAPVGSGGRSSDSTRGTDLATIATSTRGIHVAAITTTTARRTCPARVHLLHCPRSRRTPPHQRSIASYNSCARSTPPTRSAQAT